MTLQIPPITIVGTGSYSPWTAPVLWDSINVAGVIYGPLCTETWVNAQGFTVPVSGKVRVRSAKRAYRLDSKQPKGQDGWVVTYRGLKGEPFEILFYIWTQGQYDYFTESVLPLLFYSGVKNSTNPSGVQAISVVHPALFNLNINAVEVEHIGAIEPTEDGPNMYTCQVRIREYLPPPVANTTVTPTGSKTTNAPTTPGKTPDPAVTARQNTISNLRARVAAGGGTPIL
jgi:hypothetical protein